MKRPRWHDDRPLLAAVARHLHAQRLAGYPALVAAGQLTEADAADGIRIAGAIAADWRAIAAVEPAPDWIGDPDRGGAYPFERRQVLAQIAHRARTAAEAQPECFETVGLADAVDTLLWWEGQQPSARFYADVTLEARRRVAEARRAANTLFTFGEAA